jgi:hypothetical protein
MKRKLFRRALIVVLCLLLITPTSPAKAESFGAIKDEVIIAIVVAGAAIGVGLYFAFHHGASLKGCAASGPGGLALTNQGDQLVYQLSGDTADIKPGDLVRVKGKKRHAKVSTPTFLVEKLSKDYGPCPIHP